ncbi:distal tail protein Dit [Paenibacillus sp. strain BS8-2]
MIRSLKTALTFVRLAGMLAEKRPKFSASSLLEVDEMYGFTYRGRHCSELGLDLLSYSVNSPELREAEDEVTGKAGTVDYGTEWGKRTIDLKVDMKQIGTPVKLQQSLILNWIKPTLPAALLVFDEMPDRFYYAKFTGKLGTQQFGSYGQFDFAMKCTDPYVYGPEQIHEMLVTNSPQSMFVPVGGTETSYPVIRLTNVGSNTINGFTVKTISEVD